MKRIIISTQLITFLFFMHCNDDPGEPEVIYDVPEEFSVHVDSFFELALSKGFDFGRDNLIVRFEDALESNDTPVCGRAEGNLTGESQNLVLIDPECLSWRYNDRSREILIYHELGHVFLERTHEDATLPSGDFKSIMFGGTWNILEFYTEDLTKREYYLNELFNPSEPVPDWAD